MEWRVSLIKLSDDGSATVLQWQVPEKEAMAGIVSLTAHLGPPRETVVPVIDDAVKAVSDACTLLMSDP